MSNTTIDITNDQTYFRGDKIFFNYITKEAHVKFEALVMGSQKDFKLSTDFKSFRLLKVDQRNNPIEVVEWLSEKYFAILDRSDEEKLKIIEDFSGDQNHGAEN